jgi:hypothetical protein
MLPLYIAPLPLSQRQRESKVFLVRNWRYPPQLGDIPRNFPLFMFWKTRVTTNTFKSQLHYLLSNGHIARIARGVYQITLKGKKYLVLLTS